MVVLVTDLLQFVVKMTMAIVLAVVAVVAVGGIAALKDEARPRRRGAPRGRRVAAVVLPDRRTRLDAARRRFLVFVGVSWWASSYPGAEPGGGSYIAQRIFARRTSSNAVLATLFFNVAHYALRPWPWILVALCALVLYPHGVNGRKTAHSIPSSATFRRWSTTCRRRCAA